MSLLFKLLSLWHLITVALANEYAGCGAKACMQFWIMGCKRKSDGMILEGSSPPSKKIKELHSLQVCGPCCLNILYLELQQPFCHHEAN
jgi:hypothetical protein